ncbi:hypothetical protein COW80_00620 [Candidatus Beckwithbacteria bacterium CG22_combo_CG10-13_8_21_14_all_01_47_9]|uniref:Uncharacterized protein n=1 Tax=Candidatus Beckwithbacteria bacterium CG22_combo_CG10-13_8_21_14_all_01_47_9 TaxID=1974496 RepID=A0A2H0E1U1_9BACT|nr:MAG: hypothetical protein COW80_00620 [Candidatus Beckwithbacteria bacterium CG22_combo_CG10-13_8_21_14_all_01_47_9]
MTKIRKKAVGNFTGLKNDLIAGIDKKLKRFATKDDLKRFATKDDLKRFATKSDLWQLEERIDGLEEKISRLPTKNEFYTSMDKLMGEIETMRQENIISTDMKRQVNEHEERLETVEEKLEIRTLAA